MEIIHNLSNSVCIVIKGKIDERIEVTRRRGIRRKQLLNDLKENLEYWKLIEKTVDRTMWRNCFGIVYEPIVIKTTE
jgi:hypothetical protein